MGLGIDSEPKLNSDNSEGESPATMPELEKIPGLEEEEMENVD